MSAVTGMAGNLLVILVLYKCRAASRSTDILVGSLATADLLASFLMIPLPAHRTVPVSTLGYVYCCFGGSNVLMWICLGASTYSLVAISCDRYFAIVHPLQFKRHVTKGRVCLIVKFMWFIVSLLFGIPVFTSYGVDSSRNACSFLFSTNRAKAVYGCFILLFRFIIPTLILAVTQSSIAVVLHRESQTFRKAVKGTQRSVHLAARDHVIKLMLIVIIAFIICWLPSQIFFFGVNIGFISIKYFFTPTQYVCRVMALCNSCLNPIIYIVRHPNFRVALGELFRRSDSTKASGPIFEQNGVNLQNNVTISTII
nr:allatostatin-A receptor-like [Lytechinus pictus]